MVSLDSKVFAVAAVGVGAVLVAAFYFINPAAPQTGLAYVSTAVATVSTQSPTAQVVAPTVVPPATPTPYSGPPAIVGDPRNDPPITPGSCPQGQDRRRQCQGKTLFHQVCRGGNWIIEQVPNSPDC